MSSTKVLIADTDDSFRYSFIDKINSEEELQLVGETRDGEKLLSMIHETHPDVVVLESVLENIDGLEILDHLILDENRPAVIFMSHFTRGNIPQLAADKGADYFMLKPCKINIVFDRIKQISSSGKNKSLNNQQLYVRSYANKNEFSAEMEAFVSSVLLEIGMPVHLDGYKYLRTAILMSIENMEIVNSITKDIYPELAKRYNSTSTKIEHSIRHIIQTTWDHGKKDVMQRYFGYAVQTYRPTNSEFIAMIADHISIQKRLDMERANSRLHKFYI